MAARFDESARCERCIATERPRVPESEDPATDALLPRQPRDHVAITAVVSPATGDQPAPALRKIFPSGFKNRNPGSLHEFQARNPMIFDGTTIQFPNLGGGVQTLPCGGSLLVVQRGTHWEIITLNKARQTPDCETPELPGSVHDASEMSRLAERIRVWGNELGFQKLGISDIELEEHEKRLNQWLLDGFHGEMEYMARHGTRRSRPAELIPGTLRVICVRMDYLHEEASSAESLLQEHDKALISRYALGRDYHKVMRNRLQKLCQRIEDEVGQFGYRVFVDSAPVLEKALAEKAGLGWIGKHSNVLSKEAGSWFFLGEIYTDLPLPIDEPASNHCGDCRRCIDICPTDAIVAPYRVDARRCISYLTIELRSSIPEKYRSGIGNRIFGCDDCQLVCPWNRFARFSSEDDFRPRPGLDAAELVELFSWSEQEFLDRTLGSPIRRIGHECWLRNIAVALGNAGENSTSTDEIINALHSRSDHPSEMVREHVNWALAQHSRNRSNTR